MMNGTNDRSWKIGQEMLAGLSDLFKQRNQPKVNTGVHYSGNSGSVFGIAGNALKIAFGSFASFFSTLLGHVEEPSVKASVEQISHVAKTINKPGASMIDIGCGLMNSFLPGFDLKKADPTELKDVAQNMLKPTCSVPYRPTKK
tara:strand:+ start:81335 stop:81766 length:432 start_codon:yes stop_codon:yes gene_type:complete